MDFKKLKAESGQASLTYISEKVASMNESGRRNDDRFWQPTVDKGGNGFAIIRFLPPPPGEDVPFVRFFDHGFKGPGGWYIENSLTSIGKDDPVSEYNSKLWNSTTDDNSPERKQVRDQKRRLHYISNILVIRDNDNPSGDETEGKVFLFKYGRKIFNKLATAMDPEFEDETAFNPFDLWHGANFKLKIKKVDGYRNYESSSFEKVGPLYDDDTRLEEIWKSEYSLKEFLDTANFKDYKVLKDKLTRVLGGSSGGYAVEEEEEAAPKTKIRTVIAPKEEWDEPDTEDDDIKAFRSLAS